jgi:hypothetical protein
MTPAEWQKLNDEKIAARALHAARAAQAVKASHAKRRHRYADLAGRRFGSLFVEAKAPRHLWLDHQTCWLCICDCGRLKTIRQKSIVNGSSRSCGCKSRTSKLRHGSYQTAEYNVWCRMRREHLRGAVLLCEAWRYDFRAFLADVGKRPSAGLALLRLDRSRGFEPGNVAWRPRSEIARVGLAGLRRKWAGKRAA